MTNEIISCPFCGGKYIGLHTIVNSANDVDVYTECHSCGARGKRLHFCSEPESTKQKQQELIDSSWNERFVIK